MSSGDYRAFQTMLAMKYLRVSDVGWTQFISDLSTLLDAREIAVDIALLGFPIKWRELLEV